MFLSNPLSLDNEKLHEIHYCINQIYIYIIYIYIYIYSTKPAILVVLTAPNKKSAF